jgi:predicted enzyme involved in methoxymalonyl-ACP biosynthesis
MVHVAVEHARAAGATQIEAPLVPTAKNKPCLSFWQGSGFASNGETSFTWNANAPYAQPPMIALEWVR